MFKKQALAVLYGGIAYLIYLYGESILDWFQDFNNVFFLLSMATVMALFPVIPYPIVGGIGAAMDLW